MLDVKANRRAVKWTRRELLVRALWEAASPLFTLSPRPFWGWRRVLLRLFGAKVGPNVHISPSARILIPFTLTIEKGAAIGERATLYALGPIKIGVNATISQGAHLCAGTHDYRDPAMTLLKIPVTVGAHAWICADAFVGPGVTVGDGAVVGARAVVTRSIPANAVVVGNPARFVRWRYNQEINHEQAMSTMQR